MRTNTIHCGEAASVISSFPVDSVDLVVTDPPYLCNYRDRDGRSIANDDLPSSVLPVFAEVYRVLKPNSYCISFYGWNAIAQFAAAWDAAGFKTVGHIVWPKTYASRAGHALYRHESAFILAKGYPQKPANPISDVQPWRYTGNKDHPTQKSVSIIEPLIESFSKPGDLVLDPFLGSGTSAIAAALKGRDYIGIELEPSYCALARQRLAQLHEAGKLQSAASPEPRADKSTRRAATGGRRASPLFPSVTDLITIQP